MTQDGLRFLSKFKNGFLKKWLGILNKYILNSNKFEKKMAHLSYLIWHTCTCNLNLIEGLRLGATSTNVFLPLSMTLKSST